MYTTKYAVGHNFSEHIAIAIAALVELLVNMAFELITEMLID